MAKKKSELTMTRKKETTPKKATRKKATASWKEFKSTRKKISESTRKKSRAKKAPLTVRDVLREALIVVPGDSFTVDQAREALVTIMFNEGGMTALLKQMSGSRGLLISRADGTFEIRDSNKGSEGSNLRWAIRRVLCHEYRGVTLDRVTFVRLVKEHVLFADPLVDGNIINEAQRMHDVDSSGGMYRCKGT